MGPINPIPPPHEVREAIHEKNFRPSLDAGKDEEMDAPDHDRNDFQEDHLEEPRNSREPDEVRIEVRDNPARNRNPNRRAARRKRKPQSSCCCMVAVIIIVLVALAGGFAAGWYKDEWISIFKNGTTDAQADAERAEI